MAAVVVTFAVAVPALVLATGRPAAPDARLARGRAAIAGASELHWDLAAAGRWAVVANEHGAPALTIVDVTGERPAEVVAGATAFPGRPSLSPDGRHVTFQSVDAQPGRTVLQLHDRERGVTRVLVDGAGGEIVDAAWAPDGRRVVYVRTSRDPDGAWQGELRAIAPDGSGDVRLFAVPGRPARAPAFSPDGREIAFLQDATLMVIGADGGPARVLHDAGKTTPAPSAGLPDAPAWSPDGAVIAYAYLRDGCHRVQLVERATGVVRWTSPGCAMRPQIAPGGARLAYLQLGASQRTLRWAPMPGTGGAAVAGDEPIGFADGVTYEYAFTGPAALVALASTATSPRSLWAIAPGAAPRKLHDPLPAPLEPAVTSVVESTTIRSADGLELPVQVFPRTCGRGRGGAIVWLHGGPHEDIAPRWYQEPQYLAALGWTVVAVNYRGSTGNGEAFRARGDDRAGQVEDVLAALRWTAARADVDPARIVVLTVSWSTEIAYPALARTEVPVRGVIDWLGVPQAPRTPTTPPALWLSGRADRLTPQRQAVAAAAVADGHAIEHVILDGGHEFRSAAARRAALEAAERFLARHGGGACTGPVAEVR